MEIANKILKGINPKAQTTPGFNTFGSASNTVGSALKTKKEAIEIKAVVANNKDLFPEIPEANSFGFASFSIHEKVMPQVLKKKSAQKSNANIFNEKITQEKNTVSVKNNTKTFIQKKEPTKQVQEKAKDTKEDNFEKEIQEFNE